MTSGSGQGPLSCADARAALGVDVLGALEPSEQAALREHLEGCPDCRAAQAELAGVPTLLDLVSAQEVLEGLPHPGERALERLQARVRAERERELRGIRRRAWWRGAMSAAATVIVLGLGGWAFGRWAFPVDPFGPPIAVDTPRPTASSPSTPTPTPQSPSPQPGPRLTAPPIEWTRVDPRSHVSATVRMNPVPWGTKIDIVLQGVKKGDICSLAVLDKSGRRWDAGSWRVAYAQGVRWSGGVAVPADQVVRIEVYAPGDKSLVELEG
ncbi:MAG TPA: zf-HC2 domain-containing protein [Actinopolymorphaceae bacterium]|jgi:hypothetical protein